MLVDKYFQEVGGCRRRRGCGWLDLVVLNLTIAIRVMMLLLFPQLLADLDILENVEVGMLHFLMGILDRTYKVVCQDNCEKYAHT